MNGFARNLNACDYRIDFATLISLCLEYTIFKGA